MHQNLFGLLSIACSCIGYGIYIRSVLQRRTKPHLFSWAVWALVMAIVFCAQLSGGAGAGAWATGSSAAACLLIAILAVKRGETSITFSDKIALAIALLTIPVWRLTHDPLWAVILATIIDAMAYYPTYRKSWFRPQEENPYLYMMDICKWLVAFLAMADYSAITLLYPLFLIAANATLIAIIFWRRKSQPS